MTYFKYISFPKSCEAMISSSLLVVWLPLWSVYMFCYNCMYLQWLFGCTSLSNQNSRKCLLSTTMCIFTWLEFVFPFSAALFYPAGLSSRHLLYDIAVREYVVVTEWSASLWSRYRLRETQQQEKGLYSGFAPLPNSPGALCITDGAEKLRRKSRMWQLGWRKKGPRRGKATSRITELAGVA